MATRRRTRWLALAVVVVLAAVATTAGLLVRNRGDDRPPPLADGVLPYDAPDLVNPMRGQFDNIGTGLFPQSNDAQSALPDWPGTRDAAVRVTWRSLQPVDPASLPANAPDQDRFDFSQLDRALDYYGGRGMRLDLRISSYDSCCDQLPAGATNLAVPDWLVATPGAVDTYQRDGVRQVVPAWNSDVYLDRFSDLLAALGRRYDGDERLGIFEMSGYGDFSENVLAVLRDDLGAPGPAAQDSEKALGYYSQYRDQFITGAAAARLVSANLEAFPRTQMVTAPANPEIVKLLLRDSPSLADVRHPVGLRGDCLGVFDVLPTWAVDRFSTYVERGDPIIDVLTERLRTAPVLTEWCQLPDGTSSRDYYEKGLDTVIDRQVSMTASSGFPDQFGNAPMDPELYDLWSRANVYSGYRYAADADLAVEGERVTGSVRWTNYGVAATHERWSVGYQLENQDGDVVARSGSGLDLRAVDAEQDADSGRPTPATAVDSLAFDTDVPPGTYVVTAVVTWAEHKPDATRTVDYPAMDLAMRAAADGTYPVGTITVPGA